MPIVALDAGMPVNLSTELGTGTTGFWDVQNRTRGVVYMVEVDPADTPTVDAITMGYAVAPNEHRTIDLRYGATTWVVARRNGHLAAGDA